MTKPASGGQQRTPPRRSYPPLEPDPLQPFDPDDPGSSGDRLDTPRESNGSKRSQAVKES